MNLDAAIATIQSQKLRFTRVDTFDDPFEGASPKANIDAQTTMVSSEAQMQMMAQQVSHHFPGAIAPIQPREDSWSRMTRIRRAKTRSAHASCWSSDEESELLWRIYCDDEQCKSGLGVALHTNLERLEKSLEAHDLYISPVIYRRYHEGEGFKDELDSLMHKRTAFESEREIRLLRYDDKQFSQLKREPPSVGELDEYLYLDWPVADAIQEIVLSPYAKQDYEDRARSAIAAADTSLSSKVILSELNTRRNPPGY